MLSVFLSAQNLTDDRELNIDSIDNVFEMAKLYEGQNDFVSAVKEYKRVLFLQDYFKIQNYKNNVFCLEKLSDYYYKNNQYELALSYINDGLNSCIADQQLINKFLINKINISVKLLKNYELLRNDVALYALAFIDDCDIQIKKQILF